MGANETETGLSGSGAEGYIGTDCQAVTKTKPER